MPALGANHAIGCRIGRAAGADWVDPGDYGRAVAQIVAGDPDLESQ